MKPVAFSGIQPSGDLTLGNYLGALRNFKEFTTKYDAYFSIVDLHAITVKQLPKDLREHTLKNLSLYLASGLDPDKCTIFIQSHVSAHAELSWLLTCNSYLGELSRMTQYKDKSKKEKSIGAGLLIYPILMASDILLYQTDIVPIGDDQKQHLELSRTLAERFNNAYSPTFKIPEAYINKSGARIYDLQNPTSKMSKSGDNNRGIIFLLDKLDDITKKIERAVTDNEQKVRYSDSQPGIKNLINIFSLCEKLSIEESLGILEKLSYKDFKEKIAISVVKTIENLQKKYYNYYKNKELLEKIYSEGAKKANFVANKTLSKVKRKIGFIKEIR